MATHPFHRASVRYGDTPDPVTPYHKAAQVWDERLGSARSQARNWRLAALTMIALAIVLTGLLAVMVSRSGVIPYVVEVDRLGSPRRRSRPGHLPPLGRPDRPLPRPLRQNVRSLSIDPVVVRANWLRAYDYVTDRGAQTLNEYARQADPFGKIGAKTATVEVISVVRASGDSFEVRWKESTYAVAELRLGENPQRIVRIIRIDARPVSSPFAGSSAAARGRSGVSTSAPF